MRETIKNNKTNIHKKVESFQEAVAANIPGVTLHGKRMAQPNKQLIDKIYRKRRLENIKLNERT